MNFKKLLNRKGLFIAIFATLLIMGVTAIYKGSVTITGPFWAMSIGTFVTGLEVGVAYWLLYGAPPNASQKTFYGVFATWIIVLIAKGMMIHNGLEAIMTNQTWPAILALALALIPIGVMKMALNQIGTKQKNSTTPPWQNRPQQASSTPSLSWC